MCEQCRRNYTDRFCSICCLDSGNAFITNSFDGLPNNSDHPPQPQTHSFESNGDPPQVSFISNPDQCYNQNFDNNFPQTPQYLCCTHCGGPHDTFQCQQLIFYEPEPCYNQNFDDTFPQNSSSFPQQYLCCENCEVPHENFQCQPMNQNFYEPNFCNNPNYSGFVQPPQYSIDHQENLNQQRMNDVHNKFDDILELKNELLQMLQSFCEKLLQQEQAASIDQSPLQEMSIQEMEDLKQHYLNKMLSLSNDLQIKDYRNEKIDICFRRECEDTIYDLKVKFNGMSIEINKKKERKYLEQVAKLSANASQRFKSFCYDDDDDYDYEQSTIPLNEIDSQISPTNAITPVFPTLEPEDSLSMGDEHLSTSPEKESDEFIKSSVENLVLIQSESEDTSGSDSECILPSCDDFYPINVYEEKSVTFSNPLFNSNDDLTSKDDESLSDEDVPKDNDIECKVSYDSNLDESALLVTPLSDYNEDECLAPDDEIEFLLDRDPSTPTISIVSILEGFTDEPPLEENDDLFDLESKTNDWKKILYEDPIDDLIFDPGGDIDAFLDIDIPTNTKDGFYDPKGDVLYLERLLSYDTTLNFPPKDCPNYEDPRAHGFVHRSLDLQSFACLYLGIRYRRSY
ncbi:hypothetical protein Tco_0759874 [Tanacetum coccineum]